MSSASVLAAPEAPAALETSPALYPLGRKICITFGGEAYDGTTALSAMLATKFGADEFWVYDDHWLVHEQKEFHRQNRWLWEHHHKRGFGWYAWKPFIIIDALERLRDGDVVLFIDADTFPVDDFSVLYPTCVKEGGIMLFMAGGVPHKPFTQRQWCKRDCFIARGRDEPRWYDLQAGVARFMLFQKGPWRARQFLTEWLSYCVNPRATTFDPSIIAPELPGFIEHRTEQAIMSNLAHKYGITLHREACELGNAFPEDKDLYPQLFSQLNPWGNKTAPCVGSRFRNLTPGGAPKSIASRLFAKQDALTAAGIAVLRAQAGNPKAADRILSAALDQFPALIELLALRGQIQEMLGDRNGALATYERAAVACPGLGLPFTRRSAILVRGKLGAPPAPRRFDPSRPFVAMAGLGTNGRFGHQVLQYATLKLYSEKAGAVALAPDWIGRDLFGFDDPLIPQGKIDKVDEQSALDFLNSPDDRGRTRVNLEGFFCADASVWRPAKERFQSLFQPVAPVRSRAQAALDSLASKGGTLVAIHLRRQGRSATGNTWIAPSAWYLNWLASIWRQLDRPVLYLATDDPEAAQEFAEYPALTQADLPASVPGAEFYTDFWILQHADCLAISNSAFSYAASMLNRRAVRFARPDRMLAGLRCYDPWSERVVLD